MGQVRGREVDDIERREENTGIFIYIQLYSSKYRDRVLDRVEQSGDADRVKDIN